MELHVSPSTVSHQIRDLEAHLGVLLFNRKAKPMELTSEGRQLLPALSSGFGSINSAFETDRSAESEFRLGCMPFLTNEVLLPNIGDLKDSVGGAHLSFRSETSLDALIDPNPLNRLDAVIRYTNGPPGPGFMALELFDIELVPIQAMNKPVITEPEHLLQAPMIRVHGPFDAWREWAVQNGLEQDSHYPPKNIVLETDNYHAATLAARRGDGLCLGVLPFVWPWLAAGEIQVLDAFRCQIPYKASLVFAAHNESNPTLESLREWLVSHLNNERSA